MFCSTRMAEELSRNFDILKQKADPPPYFLSYEVTETDYATIAGTLGAIDATNRAKRAGRWTFRCGWDRPNSITIIA